MNVVIAHSGPITHDVRTLPGPKVRGPNPGKKVKPAQIPNCLAVNIAKMVREKKHNNNKTLRKCVQKTLAPLSQPTRSSQAEN